MAEVDSCMHYKNTNAGKKTVRYGAKVALEALDYMDALSKRDDEVSSDAKAFIEECENAGKDPIEVVKFLADQRGIDLSGRCPGEESGKVLYDLLRKVVDVVVDDAFEKELDKEDDGPGRPIIVAKCRPSAMGNLFAYLFTSEW